MIGCHTYLVTKIMELKLLKWFDLLKCYKLIFVSVSLGVDHVNKSSSVFYHHQYFQLEDHPLQEVHILIPENPPVKVDL